MKRLITLVIAAAFILGTAGMVKAAHEVRFDSVDFRVHGNYVTNPSFDDDNKDDKFNLYQRFRTNLNYIASENVRARVQLQYSMNERWGDPDGPYVMGGTDSVSFRQAYLQFMIPNTQAQVRAGHQYFILPNTLGSHIWDSRAPGIVVSSPINDMVAMTLGYARLMDEEWLGTDTTGDGIRDQRSRDNQDMFFAIAPITLDGMEINPFGVWVHEAKRFHDDGTWADDDLTSRNIYFLGINATIDMFDPIVVMADFNFGGASEYADDGGANTKVGRTRGWIANLAVQYNMDMVTPMIFALYESGESRNSAANDRTGKIMPTVNPWLNFSSFGFDGSNFGGTAGNQLRQFGLGGPSGKWALGLKLQDISFVDQLSHELMVAYYQGTNHRDSGATFTRKDKAWEVNFDHQYDIYENLAAILELGYINIDPDEGSSEDSWKAAAGFRLRF